MARKVVGVGSVGTRTWALLMTGLDQEPLMLQLKEATGLRAGARSPARAVTATRDSAWWWASSSSRPARTSSWAGPVPRPWTGSQHDFYVRQLWDWKISADVEKQSPATMAIYGQICGWTLARGHARSGDRCAIAAYLGQGDVFDLAVGDFARAYAEQNEADYGQLMQAARDGRIEMTSEA